MRRLWYFLRALVGSRLHWQLFRLCSRSEYTRRSAALMLGDMGDGEAIPALWRSLRDEDPYFRRAVIAALGELKDVRAVEPLVSVLKSDCDYAWLKVDAAQALGQIGRPEAIPALSAIRSSGESEEACKAANEALRSIREADRTTNDVKPGELALRARQAKMALQLCVERQQIAAELARDVQISEEYDLPAGKARARLLRTMKELEFQRGLIVDGVFGSGWSYWLRRIAFWFGRYPSGVNPEQANGHN